MSSSPIPHERVAVKEHVHPQGSVLAAADESVLGKVLKEGKIVFNVSQTFYFGEWNTQEELKKRMEDADNINLVGILCLQAAVEKKLVDPGKAIYIEGIPHAQIYKV